MTQHKCCSTCKEIKAISEFHKEANGLYGVRGDCKLCKIKAKLNWDKCNIEKRKEQKKRNYWKHKEEKLAKSKRWQENNQEYLTEYRKKMYKEQNKNSPEYRYKKLENKIHKRPHYKLTFSLTQFIDWCSNNEYKCYYCGDPISGTNYQLDRLNPERGYDIDNIVNCCKYCNYAKSDLSVEDFIEKVKKVYNLHAKKT